MKPSWRLLLVGSALAALTVGIWAWRDHQQALARARQQVWMAYLHGPLSDLLEGSSRGRALLEQSLQHPLNPQQRHELADAAADLRRADDGAKTFARAWEADAFFQPLSGVLPWHSALADAARDWEKLAGRKDLVPGALDAEKGLRRNLAGVLDRQRERVFDAGRLGMDQGLEINALLFSLKE
jgi:hypothetical protein